jgi:predicted SprT family Zn-dependent metalloprotease
MSTVALRIAQAVAKVQTILNVASIKYDIPNLDQIIDLTFDLKGNCAGIAKGFNLLPPTNINRISSNSKFVIRLNQVMMMEEEGFQHIMEDTIPHEIAHIVCFAKPSYGNAHNSGWKQICVELGGSGRTCHQQKVYFGKGNTYQYKSVTGKEVMVSDKYHKKIQSGISLTYRKAGLVDKSCSYTLVARSGIPVNNPVVKTEIKAVPVEIVSTKKMTKAGTVRAWIATGNYSKEELIEKAINELGMKKGLATIYVRNLLAEV